MQAGAHQSLAQVRTSWGLVNGPDSPQTPEPLNQKALGVEERVRQLGKCLFNNLSTSL